MTPHSCKHSKLPIRAIQQCRPDCSVPVFTSTVPPGCTVLPCTVISSSRVIGTFLDRVQTHSSSETLDSSLCSHRRSKKTTNRPNFFPWLVVQLKLVPLPVIQSSLLKLSRGHPILLYPILHSSHFYTSSCHHPVSRCTYTLLHTVIYYQYVTCTHKHTCKCSIQQETRHFHTRQLLSTLHKCLKQDRNSAVSMTKKKCRDRPKACKWVRRTGTTQTPCDGFENQKSSCQARCSAKVPNPMVHLGTPVCKTKAHAAKDKKHSTLAWQF